MTVHTTAIRYVVQALSEPHKIHRKIRESYTMTECRSRLYRGSGADAPALQDGAQLGIFTTETTMYGTITQEYNKIQSTVAFCLPKLTCSYAILRHLAHYSRRVRRGSA
jgi:hypothetical protein